MRDNDMGSPGLTSLAEMQSVWTVDIRRIKEDIGDLLDKYEAVQDRITVEAQATQLRMAAELTEIRDRISNVANKLAVLDGIDQRMTANMSRDLDNLRRDIDSKISAALVTHKLEAEREFSLTELRSLQAAVHTGIPATLTELEASMTRWQEEQKKALDDHRKDLDTVKTKQTETDNKVFKIVTVGAVVILALLWVGKVVFLPSLEDTAKSAAGFTKTRDSIAAAQATPRGTKDSAKAQR